MHAYACVSNNVRPSYKNLFSNSAGEKIIICYNSAVLNGLLILL